MDEELIIVQSQEDYENATVEDLSLDVEQSETVEYIEVDAPEEINIEIEETIGSPSVGDGNYAPLEHTHPISEIEELSNTLHNLASVKDYYSIHGGYAEFRPWKDKNPNQENRVEYFVSLVDNNDNNEWIEVCNSELNDVYGVVVSNSGFCGKQSSDYNILDEKSLNRATNPSWAKVCLLGTVSVRFGGSQQEFVNLQSGDFVVPDGKGCAKKSDNNVGFKVITKEAAGIGENAWNKVSISLVPQNDNVARVMKKLEETNKGLGELQIQIGNLDEKIDTNISISGDFAELEKEFEDLGIKVEDKLNAATTTLETAQQISNEVIEKMEEMVTNYDEAMNQTEMAKSDAQAALDQISSHQDNLNILSQYGNNIVGFFAEASEDEVSVGTIARTQGDVSMIKQTSKDLQNLVCHVDVYSVGKQSPTIGLSYNESQGALGVYEYIYVPIIDHWEYSPIYTCTPTKGDNESKYWFKINSTKYYFIAPKILVNEHLIYNKKTNRLIIENDENTNIELSIITETSADMIQLDFKNEKSIHFEVNNETSVGKSYKWSQTDNNDEFWWSEGVSVIHSEGVPTGDYELWYTHNGVQDPDTNEYIYNPGTLYRKTKSSWIAVATINDKNTRTMSYINQTADEISSTITNVGGQVSTISQKVDEIEMLVRDGGQLSEIQQTAENIRLGVYDAGGGASSLELLLSGFRSDATNTEHVWVCKFLDTYPQSDKYYKSAPIWNGTEFVFDEENFSNASNDEFCYCYGTKDNTYYHIVSDGYDVYTNGNTALASIKSRVSDTESEITRLTQVDTELGNNITAVQDKSDENSAQISSIASMQNAICLERKDELSAEENILFVNANKYNKPPIWDSDKFVFQSTSTDDGIYCMIDNDTESYYKILISDGNIIGYEQYGLSSAKLAVIEQEVDKNGASISMVVDDNGVKGGIIAKAINDQSEVLIEADKIGIRGTAVFSDSFSNDKTTISGNYIRTGVISSNNYVGPVTYRMYGAIIGDDEEGNKIITISETISDCIYYTPIVNSESLITDYYYASDIKVNEKLFTEKQDDSVYIVSAKDFDLVPSDFEHQGTRFDLNNGTIYSKNLTLDRDGNLSITGKITATSGYIGDEKNGFTIGYHDNGYYSLSNNQTSVWSDRSRNTPGIYIGPDGIGLGNGAFGITNNGYLGTQGNIEVYKIIKNTDGTQSSDLFFGVYPYGGTDVLGNSKSDGSVIINGDISLDGNITLSGSITWDNSNSPVCVLYAASQLNNPRVLFPDRNYDDYPKNSSTSWHKVYQDEKEGSLEKDYYASYSYDGGKTWTDAVKIRGTDGEDGLPGSAANVTAQNVFNALTKGGENQGLFSAFYGDKDRLFINAEYISGQVLSGVVVESVINTTDNNVGVTRLETGALSFYPEYDRSEGADNVAKLKIGYAENDANEPYMQFGGGTGAGSIQVDNGPKFVYGTGMLWKNDDAFVAGLIGSDKKRQLIYFADSNYNSNKKYSHIAFHDDTIIDFSSATVEGLKITFG